MSLENVWGETQRVRAVMGERVICTICTQLEIKFGPGNSSNFFRTFFFAKGQNVNVFEMSRHKWRQSATSRGRRKRKTESEAAPAAEKWDSDVRYGTERTFAPPKVAETCPCSFNLTRSPAGRRNSPRKKTYIRIQTKKIREVGLVGGGKAWNTLEIKYFLQAI